MSDEVKNAPQLRVGLINEILSEVIFIRMDQPLWKFFRWTSHKQWCRPMPEEHFERLDLSLTQEKIRMGCYSTRKSGGEALAFRSCRPLTFPWTDYQADDVLLGSVGSTGKRKSM
jgi:hypothetical protein